MQKTRRVSARVTHHLQQTPQAEEARQLLTSKEIHSRGAIWSSLHLCKPKKLQSWRRSWLAKGYILYYAVPLEKFNDGERKRKGAPSQAALGLNSLSALMLIKHDVERRGEKGIVAAADMM